MRIILLAALFLFPVLGFAESFEEVKAKAEAGDAEEQYIIGISSLFIGRTFKDNDAMSKSFAKAFKWLSKAGEQGHAGAQLNIGEMYTLGQGVSMNYTEAFKWYKKAALQGHKTAVYSISFCYAHGNGVEEDLVEAYAWYIVLAATGEAWAWREIKEGDLKPGQIAAGKKRSKELLKLIEANNKAKGWPEYITRRQR